LRAPCCIDVSCHMLPNIGALCLTVAAPARRRLTHDPLSQSAGAVVLDPLGHMFNKEAVLPALLAKKLDKKPMPPGLEHVKSLKVSHRDSDETNANGNV
jgi:hypothetical protein